MSLSRRIRFIAHLAHRLWRNVTWSVAWAPLLDTYVRDSYKPLSISIHCRFPLNWYPMWLCSQLILCCAYTRIAFKGFFNRMCQEFFLEIGGYELMIPLTISQKSIKIKLWHNIIIYLVFRQKEKKCLT